MATEPFIAEVQLTHPELALTRTIEAVPEMMVELEFDLLPRLKPRESRHGISGLSWPCGFKTHAFQASPAG